MAPITAQSVNRLPLPHDDLPAWPACLHWAPGSRRYWATLLGRETPRCVAVVPLPAWTSADAVASGQSPAEVLVARPGPRGWNWDEPEWRAAFAARADADAAAAEMLDNLAARCMERAL